MLLALLAIAAAAVLMTLQSDDDALVVYCAHDAAYSQAVLDEFTQQTGIKVAVRFDTEATKSLGLVNLLIAERENPRCDVFWNNLVLGTVQLQEHGILHPYKGDGWKRIPSEYKDPDGTWTGFAGRLRVLIYNTDKLTKDQLDLNLSGTLDRFAFAKPLYGTTLAHFSVLHNDNGSEHTKAFLADLNKRGANMVAGNSAVKNLVANGSCDFGWTDTDDYFVAVDDGLPVQITPILTGDGKTICIPNSVSIIKGTGRLDQAQQLVDFLLSKNNELRLAGSRSRQIPLGEVDESELPEDVKPLAIWAKNAIRYDDALFNAHQQCVDWLSAEFLK